MCTDVANSSAGVDVALSSALMFGPTGIPVGPTAEVGVVRAVETTLPIGGDVGGTMAAVESQWCLVEARNRDQQEQKLDGASLDLGIR